MDQAADALAEVDNTHEKVGFPGAMGSVDVTHVYHSGVAHSGKVKHVGKEGYPTLAYHVTVD